MAVLSQASMLLFILGAAVVTASLQSIAQDLDAEVSVDSYHARALQQAVKPCRWNTKYSSCDFNYDYVARINPTTPTARAAKAWFANAKVCDSAAYQASQAKCIGDDLHFCKWSFGTCTAILQDYYNYLLACAGSVAKDFYLCKTKLTAGNCAKYKVCRWIKPAGRAAYCTSLTSLGRPTLSTYLNSLSLPVFRQAWGVCASSNAAFNQTRCTNSNTKASCIGQKYCTYGVFTNNGVSTGVCYTSTTYSPLFQYQRDPSFLNLIKVCGKTTQAACEGTAVRVAAFNGK